MNGFWSYLRSVYIVKRNFSDKEITIKIPQKTKKEKNEALMQIMPVLISIGTMLLFVVIYGMIQSAQNSGGGFSLGSMGMYFVFMAASVVSGIVTSKMQRKTKENEENAAIEKWTKQLRKHEDDIQEEYAERINYQKNCYIDLPEQILAIVDSKNTYLWNVMESHNDFLSESLGASEVRSGITVKTDGDTESLERALAERVDRIVYNYAFLHNAPFPIDLKDNARIGVYGKYSKEFVTSFVTRLCVRHGYDILKCALICNSENCSNFSWIRWMPHIWDDVKCYRYILRDAKQTSDYFENFQQIIEAEVKKMNDGFYLPFYVFIIAEDSYIYGEKVIKEILELVHKKRAAIIAVGQERRDIPSFCNAWIDASQHTSFLYNSEYPEGRGKQFEIPIISEITAEKISRGLSRLSLMDAFSDTRIPTKIGFLDLLYKDGTFKGDLSVGDNIKRLWSRATIPSEIYCLCGAVEDSAIYKIKIDQIKHAILAGKTRSGKSQFLMAFIAYLMVNYPPTFVQFLFMDFKGAALSTNFRNTPHCAGSFSDLDKGDASKIVRLREMLDAEITRRETLITNANIPVHDLEHYNLAVQQSGSKNFIPHLFVVVDEYVELLSHHDEFIKDFERFSRVGASNGIHLFLASQRLDEKVNGQIRTNIDVSICFKVNLQEESRSVINCAGAESVKFIGRGFIKTEKEVREFQAPWVEKPYTPFSYDSRKGIYTVDLDGKRGQLGTPLESKQGNYTELNVITKTLETQRRGTIKKVFSDEIGHEEFWTKADLEYFERARFAKHDLSVIFGVSDDFYSHSHTAAKVNISGNHYFVVGGSKKGKSTLLQSITYSTCMSYGPKQVNIYICDMSSRDFNPFTRFPQVHNNVIDNIEQFFRLLAYIEKTISERKKLFGDEYSTLSEFRDNNPNANVPVLLVLIDDIDNLIEDYEIVADKLKGLIVNSCERYGVQFIVTAKRYAEIRYFGRLFDKKIAFYSPSESAENIMEMSNSITLQDIPGRCLVENSGRILVTQVFAFPQEHGKTIRETTEKVIEKSISQLPKEWFSGSPYQIVKKVESSTMRTLQQNAHSETALIPLFVDNNENIPVFLDSKSLNSIFVLGEFRDTVKYIKTLVCSLLDANVGVFVIDFADELSVTKERQDNLYSFDFDSVSRFIDIYNEFSRQNPNAARVIITIGITDIYEAMDCKKQGALDGIDSLLSEIYSSPRGSNQYWIASDNLQNIHFEMFSHESFTIELMECGRLFKKNPRFIEIGTARDFSPYKPGLLDIEYNNRELPKNQAWFGYRGSYYRVVLPNEE